jgi:hypothetical protein
MRQRIAFLIILSFLGVLGTQDEVLAWGRWRRHRCQPAPYRWQLAAPGDTSSPSNGVWFRDPKGVVHWVIDSDELDVQELKEPSELAKPRARPDKASADAGIWDGSDGETFCRTARRAAKTSVAHGTTMQFDTFQEFHDWLPKQKDMENLHIPRGIDSNRVDKEKYDVTIVAYLYAAAKQSDNDFHLIVGGGPNAPTSRKMNVEISGLSPLGYPDRDTLVSAREAFKAFCLTEWSSLPKSTFKFCQPPLKVRITGSIFFDVEHGPGAVGPGSLSGDIDTSWEIHPITRFEVIGN